LALIYSRKDLTSDEERHAAFSLMPIIEGVLEEEGIDADDIEEMATSLACSFVRNDESNYSEIYEQVYKDATGEKPDNNPYDNEDDDEDEDD